MSKFVEAEKNAFCNFSSRIQNAKIRIAVTGKNFNFKFLQNNKKMEKMR